MTSTTKFHRAGVALMAAGTLLIVICALLFALRGWNAAIFSSMVLAPVIVTGVAVKVPVAAGAVAVAGGLFGAFFLTGLDPLAYISCLRRWGYSSSAGFCCLSRP